MALFTEEKVLSENQHEQLEINTMEIDEDFAFFFDNTKTANSAEYGEFLVCQGLKLDLDADDEEALVSSATPVSFIANTLLKNKVEEGGFLRGELYRVVKKWDKGQKFGDGRTAKGYGYDLFHLKAGDALAKQLAAHYKQALGGGVNLQERAVDTTPEAKAPSKPKPKVG